MKAAKFIRPLLLLLSAAIVFTSCGVVSSTAKSRGEVFSAGFAKKALQYEDMSSYYIAGYSNGNHPQGVLDPQQLRAVWLDNGYSSVLLIAVDCVALDGGTVKEIRRALKPFSRDTECDSINIISTHTHAGVDTLGLWGPIGINGKNEEFNEQIISVATQVARAAYENRSTGRLLYSSTPTEELQHDSRAPYVYDPNLYQLRFEPHDSTRSCIRIVSFAAHAEALRGANRYISADLAGALADFAYKHTGDELVFLPGAIGGLIMTPELDSADSQNNLLLTAEALGAYLLSHEGERELTPVLSISKAEFKTPLDNTLFIYYKFLGILKNDVERSPFGGYTLTSELSLLQLGDITMALLPGEIFPELISGTGNSADGEGLAQIAAEYGIENLVPIGLANDELGYIVPKSEFVLDAEAPYVNGPKGHYEETNSTGPLCAENIKKAFRTAALNLTK